MLGLPDNVIGPIFAALIAGLAAFLGLIISKEQKVSEFRQVWIDGLRADIAAVIAHAQAIHGAFLAEFETNAETWKEAREDFFGINAAIARIKLRLNPTEKPSIDVLDLMEEYESLFGSAGTPAFDKLDPVEKKLIKNAQVLLKQEWRRVKRGEAFYAGVKFFALALIITCIIVFGYYFFKAW